MVKRAQIATEYIIVVGFAILIIIPLVLIFSQYMIETKDQVSSTQADRITKQIIDSAESVYYIGTPSKTTLKVYIPDNVEQINIGNNEVVFVINTKSGLSEVVQSTDINITGSIPTSPGIKNILIESKGTYVLINGT